MTDTDVYEALVAAATAGRPVALATIVRTRGSVPRHAGSKMLIDPMHGLVGTIGGGCGEADVLEAARQALNDGQCRIVQVELTDSITSFSPAVCGGIMEVFVEPIRLEIQTGGDSQTVQAQLLHNDDVVAGGYPAAVRDIISLAEHRRAREIITSFPDYQLTRLHNLDQVTADLGMGAVWLKDESTRFGLGAFKSVGGAYAVYRVLEQRILEQDPHANVSPAALTAGAYGDISSSVTFACASAGNHGRAVAWGAQLFGARCVVYLYQGVSPGRASAIESLGAIVDASAPDYDYAVRKIAEDADRNGWLVISDTAYGDYRAVPRLVMQGYTVIAQEVLDQLESIGDKLPTHVLLQAGVGGFAGAIAAHIWERLGPRRPRFIVVEPAGAACVRQCMSDRRFSTLASSRSIMGGLNCAEASTIAWEILQSAADWSVTVEDSEAVAAMRSLGSLGIIAGESGAAGFAALRSLAGDPAARAELGLDQNARVLVFSTEGATDPATYHALTGLDCSAREPSGRAREELHA